MTRPVISIAAVSYLNTIPFLYGIRHSAGSGAELLLSPPNGCAQAFDSRKADIALIPVGALGGLADRDFDIVTPWCIGADGPVRTVVMMSDSPLNEIRRVRLDGHSMTSVRLAKTLARQYWKINPKWEEPDDYRALAAPEPGDAFVLIGDKVFDNERRFARTWDLAEEWKKHTDLPFVFAVWVARKSVPDETIAAFEDALMLGMERIWESILESEYADRDYAYEYLTRNIDYFFDGPKHKALQRFVESLRDASAHPNPG